MPNHSDDLRSKPEEILARIDSVRGRLGDDVTSARSSVKELTDWRRVVQRFPWAAVGLAAAVGYLVVPKRRVEQTVDPKALEKMAKEHRVVVTPPAYEPQQKGLGNAIVAVVAASLARAVVGYLGERVTHSISAVKNSSD
jgi:hypothetical protein